jgi:hypothetical protein
MGFAVRFREEIDMDIGFAAKSTGGFTPTGPVRPDPYQYGRPCRPISHRRRP